MASITSGIRKDHTIPSNDPLYRLTSSRWTSVRKRLQLRSTLPKRSRGEVENVCTLDPYHISRDSVIGFTRKKAPPKLQCRPNAFCTTTARPATCARDKDVGIVDECMGERACPNQIGHSCIRRGSATPATVGIEWQAQSTRWRTASLPSVGIVFAPAVIRYPHV